MAERLKPEGQELENVRHPRAGWAEAFSRMPANGDDALLDAEQPTEWDLSEWAW